MLETTDGGQVVLKLVVVGVNTVGVVVVAVRWLMVFAYHFYCVVFLHVLSG